jgi:ABC-type polysaccharide/polyol phosphate transport system ATPase subunit
VLEKIIAASEDITMVLSSNNTQVMKWCTRTVVLQDGVMVGDGHYKELSQSADFAAWIGGLVTD